MSRPYRILIVDDTRGIHDDIKKVLGCGPSTDTAVSSFDALDAELFGATAPKQRPTAALTCDSAYQGEDALGLIVRAIAEERPYSVAIVDMRMPPGWDGVETIKHLWHVDPNLQVIICSAHSDWSWEDIVGELGERENLLILKKPFAPSEVSQMVTALTQNWALKQRVEQQVNALEKLVQERTRSLSALGSLAVHVAHEVNNPLAFILNNHTFLAELVDEIRRGQTVPPTDLADSAEALQHNIEGLVRIKKIVTDLTQYADAVQGKPDDAPEDGLRPSMRIRLSAITGG